ncbi:ARABIDOPSIS HOMOLOG OF YEAST CDT1, homolog of yeast CDT1 A, ARABIDOPSIS HOMOLOG OF YEAST CDT1 A [Hibiscus trionum]|uniref:ARABIDOPSIS HOMOLOG OF YEAST CDT1, homolog of yeast CDT1 A, ARABIDOPSIS HOMOLOG OF YEAST CDT1 A n=1 Tax=Hibiscus trionum TaxID=183268 RepID=A0A9W7GX46_HIBTR|nr:ARABIDOPSIS HOMOLOG OF YEAST CDT1, homolog of yeast CDT1 A, ARABIDOPSIS HOMOLOG OF YEAST CDT1 A [Hibiscus trionum]
MNSSDSLTSTPLKSKASRSLTSKSPVSKTPEKRSSQLPNRARNRGVALSIKEIRQVAQTRSKAPTDQINSARKQILSCPTESPPPKASCRRPDKLPEKYEILCEFYNSLDSAIRLLRSKGSIPTLTNISPKIECLTDRRFLYSHLAQLKHILPEAIEIKRMLVFDEMTSCMKPDLHVSIILDAIDFGDNSKTETKNLKLRKVFRTRLVDFSNAHPEGDEIPEDDLPEPFNRSKQSLQLNASSIYTLTEKQSLAVQGEDIQNEVEPHPSNRTNSNSKLAPENLPGSVNDQQPVVASHLSRSFRKRFSLKTTNKAQEALQNVPEICADRSASSGDTTFAPTPSPTRFLSKQTTSETHPKNCLPTTPVKELTPLKTEDESHKKAASIDSTPVKILSTPARLMTATPTLQPQKRCYMSPDEVSTTSSNKLVRRPQRTRSLKFEEKLVDEVHEMADIDKNDVLSILPESLRHSIREKERKALEQRDPAISQAKRRQRMIACLPKLFNMIHYFFQSIKRTVITKEELMHKLIAGHCDISDRGEVEEQLKLLQELAPEWINEKVASAGDVLVCINKVSSPESIRMRLQEAK